MDVNLIDFADKKWVFKLFKSNSKVFEVNTLSLAIVCIIFLFGKINKAIFIDHNASRNYFGVKKRILIWFLRGAKEVWVVNEELKLFYPETFNVKVISPFLPPDETQYHNLLQSYPVTVKNFIKRGVFLVNSSWKYTPYKNTDLYGIETSVRLLKVNQNIRLLLVIAQYEPEDMPDTLVSEINKNIQNGRLCLLAGQSQLWPVFKCDAICLRLTPLDGDSVSIKEALHFGVPVIASDSVLRPNGCIIYDYNCFEDLVNKVSEVI